MKSEAEIRESRLAAAKKAAESLIEKGQMTRRQAKKKFPFLYGIIILSFLILAASGGMSVPAQEEVEMQAVEMNAVPNAVPVEPDVEERWIVERTTYLWSEVGKVQSYDFCPGGHVGEGITVVALDLIGPVDLRESVERLDGHDIRGPYEVESWDEAWGHDGIVLVLTSHAIYSGDKTYGGWGCTGRAVVDASSIRNYEDAGCGWKLVLHELGHAWGHRHSDEGLMKRGVHCEEAEKGFVGVGA